MKDTGEAARDSDGAPRRRRFNGPAVGAVLAGALVLLLAIPVFPLAFVVAPVAFWLGTRALRLVDRAGAPGRALAWWGIAAAGIGYLIATGAAVVAFTLLADPEVRDAIAQIRGRAP